MRPLDLLRRNESFVDSIQGIAPQYFDLLSQGQEPTCLMLACSDSRVSPSVVTQAPLGTMFVVRNIANQVIPEDLSFQSALYYALTQLKVRRVVIKGHTGCGGIAAATSGEAIPELEGWLSHVKEGLESALAVGASPDDMARANVLAQVERLKAHPTFIKYGRRVAIEGYLLHLGSGRLEKLVEEWGAIDLEVMEHADAEGARSVPSP